MTSFKVWWQLTRTQPWCSSKRASMSKQDELREGKSTTWQLLMKRRPVWSFQHAASHFTDQVWGKLWRGHLQSGLPSSHLPQVIVQRLQQIWNQWRETPDVIGRLRCKNQTLNIVVFLKRKKKGIHTFSIIKYNSQSSSCQVKPMWDCSAHLKVYCYFIFYTI